MSVLIGAGDIVLMLLAIYTVPVRALIETFYGDLKGPKRGRFLRREDPGEPNQACTT